jgi:hypothetical protein
VCDDDDDGDDDDDDDGGGGGGVSCCASQGLRYEDFGELVSHLRVELTSG